MNRSLGRIRAIIDEMSVESTVLELDDHGSREFFQSFTNQLQNYLMFSLMTSKIIYFLSLVGSIIN